jgi:PilZ domain
LSRRVETIFAETLQPLQLAFAVTMDHGVATFPPDGDQPDQLIRVADERLYRLKHANHTRTAESSPRATPATPSPAPEPIPINSGRAQAETPPPSGIEQASSQAAQSLTSQTLPNPETPATYAVQRKAERVSMSGTNAYAVIGDGGARRARVLDLGFGGVSLEFDQPEELPENLVAVLHVPILPPVRVALRAVWSRKTQEGTFRLGCHFVS